MGEDGLKRSIRPYKNMAQDGLKNILSTKNSLAQTMTYLDKLAAHNSSHLQPLIFYLEKKSFFFLFFFVDPEAMFKRERKGFPINMFSKDFLPFYLH